MFCGGEGLQETDHAPRSTRPDGQTRGNCQDAHLVAIGPGKIIAHKTEETGDPQQQELIREAHVRGANQSHRVIGGDPVPRPEANDDHAQAHDQDHS